MNTIMHHYQFHIGDYASHTSHLDELEDLAYRRMLDYCYLNEIGLPESVEEVARLIRMRTQCERIANVLQEFFVSENGTWRQPRVDLEVTEFRSKSDKAKKAAHKRWENTDANAMRTHSERNANREPLTVNRKPIKTLVAVAPDLPDYINSESWAEWVEYRRQAKKKMTPATVTKQIMFLQQHDKPTQAIIINQSIQNGWAGLFVPKEQSNGNFTNAVNGFADTRKLSGAERTRLAREQAFARQRAAESSDMECVGADQVSVSSIVR